MSRYIDADALIRYGKCGTLVYWEDIENAPSVDIVRCRECKHWQTDWTSEEGVDDYHYCPMVDRSTFDDWHCADGEREGE